MLKTQASYTHFGADAEVAVLPYMLGQATESGGGLGKPYCEFLVNSGVPRDGRSKIFELFYIFKSYVINCEKAGITECGIVTVFLRLMVRPNLSHDLEK